MESDENKMHQLKWIHLFYRYVDLDDLYAHDSGQVFYANKNFARNSMHIVK